MIKLLFTALCLSALAGCGDSKQAKLEECIAEAEQRFVQEGAKGEGVVGWEARGCLKPGATYGTCAEALDAKRQKIADEDRCIKLFK